MPAYSAEAMNRLLLLTSILLLPRVAFSHDGHPHVGDPVTHHVVEGVLLAAAFVALVVWGMRSRGTRGVRERV